MMHYYTTATDLIPIRGLVALSLGSTDTEDVWCIDHLGILTLFLTKETYYELGLTGEKISKKSSERFGRPRILDVTSPLILKSHEYWI